MLKEGWALRQTLPGLQTTKAKAQGMFQQLEVEWQQGNDVTGEASGGEE